MALFTRFRPAPCDSRGIRFGSLINLVLFSVFLLHALSASAWVYCPDKKPLSELTELASGTIMVLDPDQWSRSEILLLRKQGLLPIALLDIAHRESTRTFSHLIDEKWLVIPKFSPPPDPAPVRFYLATWKKLLLSRVDQIAHIGFAGVFLAGSSAAGKITDHPTIEREMQNWVSTVSRHFKELGIGPGLVFLKHEAGTIPSPNLYDRVDGIVVSQLWYTVGGRNLHPWDRTAALEQLSTWVSKGKRVLTLDFPPRLQDRHPVADEARLLRFDPAFAAPKGEH